MHHRFRFVVLGLVGLLALAPAAGAARHKAAPGPKPVSGILLSLGDSYSVGWQELPGGTQGSTHNGPADQLVPLAAARGWHMTLANLGCGGATTTSMLTVSAVGCDPRGVSAKWRDPTREWHAFARTFSNAAATKDVMSEKISIT